METQNIELHRVVATAIIHKDGKYLIVKRNPNKRVMPGKWTVPGGGLEVTDYINTPKTTADAWYYAMENSLRREVKEEVGLEIDKINYLASLVFIRPDGVPTLVLSMFANHKNGEVKLGEGLTEYSWVNLEEAKKYQLIPGIYEEIEMLDKHLKGEKLGEWGKSD